MTQQEITELELRSDTAERALMGAVAHHPDAMASVLAALPAEDFANPHRAYVWTACRDLSANRKPIEPSSVARKLAEMDVWRAAVQTVVTVEMLDATPAHRANLYADEVADLARRREMLRLVNAARTIVVEHPGEASEVLAKVRAQFDGVDPDADAKAGGSLRWSALIEEFEVEHSPDTDRLCIPTPWHEVDRLLGGLYGTRVYVFGGRPGQGKSTAALNIAMHAAMTGHETLVFSKEMPTVDVTGRLLARGAEVDLHEINSRRLSPQSRAKIQAYVREVGSVPITVDARPRNLAGIKTLARSHKHRRGLDVLVVDYLQLIHTDLPSRSREQEVAQVSMQLKRLAMELECAVVLPAQLNRGSLQRADQRPNMADLRDSGQIEQDADVVILLHREKDGDGHYNGTISFIVDKNRHGPTAEIALDWRGGYGAIA